MDAPVKAVCFTGHRPKGLPAVGSEAYDALVKRLYSAIDDAIAAGADTFLAGGALGFDMMAEEAVLARRSAGAPIRLILALPAPDQADDFSPADRARYDAVLSAADEVRYLAESCSTHAMHARNRYLVDHSDSCICYLSHMRGGTLYTVNRALQAGLPVRNLAIAE